MLFQLLLFLLAPIAVYCLFLATLNRRLRPVMMRGHWDFVGLLFAASGFLLVVVPGLLVSFYHRNLRQAAEDRVSPTIEETIGELWLEWWWAWVLYYTLIIVGSVVLLLWRKQKTVIYNIDPSEFERLLARVLEHRGLDGKRVAGRWTLRESREQVAAGEAGSLVRVASPRDAIVDVEIFPSLCHVTLHWREHDPSLRDEIESAFVKRFGEVATYENPAASWFLGVSGFLFGLLFLIVLVLILNELFPRRA